MRRENHRAFNAEIGRYKNALTYCAQSNDWKNFRANAEKLFDYCEAVEALEIERRFTRVFWIIIGFVITGLFLMIRIEPWALPGFQNVKKLIFFTTFAGSCFDLYFYLNFRVYMNHKAVFYKNRKKDFIIAIERDFRRDVRENISKKPTVVDLDSGKKAERGIDASSA